MKRLIKHLLEIIFEIEANVAKKWAACAHKRLFFAQWSIAPSPEWFDHSIDLYYDWPKSRNPLWLERGIYSCLCLSGGNTLELSCGDGFNTRNFYSLRSKKIIACDFDPTAIRAAKKKNSAPNVEYVLADIRTQMPKGEFENVIWDAAIEHFTPAEIESIMKNIKSRLKNNGVFSGYTLLEKDDGEKHLHQHEYEFKDKQDLYQFLKPHYKNVRVFETVYPNRHNLYFWASDGEIPFMENWSKMI